MAEAIIVVLMYLASRFVYANLGLGFNSDLLYYWWQYADIELLKTRLWETVYYLHSQPPFPNLWVGIVVKYVPEIFWHRFFYFCHLVMGALMSVALFQILRGMGIGKKTTWIFILIQLINPVGVLFEDLYHYDYALPVFFIFAAWGLLFYVKKKKAVYFAAYIISLFAISMTRGAYGPVWLLVFLALPFAVGKALNRRHLLIAILPLIIVLSFYFKNWHEFGYFSLTTTWSKQDLAKMTISQLPGNLRQQLVQDQLLGQVCQYTPQRVPLKRFQKFIKPGDHKGIAVLKNNLKQNGEVNLHHIDYLEISRLYEKDTWYVLNHYPQYYLKAVIAGMRVWLIVPAVGTYGFFSYISGYSQLWPHLTRISNLIFFGSWLIFIACMIFIGFLFLKRRIFNKANSLAPVLVDLGNRAVILFCMAQILIVFFGSAMLEHDEHERYRFTVGILIWIVLAYMLKYTQNEIIKSIPFQLRLKAKYFFSLARLRRKTNSILRRVRPS